MAKDKKKRESAKKQRFKEYDDARDKRISSRVASIKAYDGDVDQRETERVERKLQWYRRSLPPKKKKK